MKLLVIEGVDGSGKSTQIKLLNDWFKKKGKECKYLHFPRTDSPFFGELIARFLRGEFGSLNQVSPWLVAILYAGDRRDASGLVNEWLRSGSIVILDRYTFSNIAYQCAKLDEGKEREELTEWILDLEFRHFGIPVPDLNIFLDVPFAFTEKKLLLSRTGDDRKYLGGTRDIHEESLLFQKKVREVYLQLARREDRLQIINCSNEQGEMLPPQKISELIIDLLTDRKIL